ncbi:MAG: N utilization substance protein A [Pelagibacterales bacterium]|nr:N utilization substance protein A [Pelagibacterales bacterium]
MENIKKASMLNRGLDKSELLRIVEAVANEKSIDKEIVLESMESAIQKAALTKFGNDNTIEVNIDRTNGEIKIQKVLEIVENIQDPSKEIILKDAHSLDKKNKELKVGDKIFEELPQIDFGRIAAQSAKQVISLRVKEAEKNKQYEDFIDKQEQILTGIIKRLEYGNVILDLGRAEAVIKKDELIPREILKPGERVKAYCYEVKKELKGHQIFLSRAHPQFLAKLFFQEVPEIYEGIIEIKSVARDPGSRAKICVTSNDTSIDPVGACVGMRGSRVQTIVNELHGEKIDIIKWTEDLPTLISESLSPAEILKVLIDEENKRIDVILTEENLSKAIGRRGQNVRLASKLTNYEIDILTDKEDSERRQNEFKEKTETLIKSLEVDETLGQLLVSEGLQGIEEISQSSPEDISKIEGIDEDTAKELIERSKENLIKEKEEVAKRLKELGVEETLINLKGITQGMVVILGQRGIKKLGEFADLSSDELIGGFDEIKGKKIRLEGYLEEFSLSREEADQLIMSAREIAFK